MSSRLSITEHSRDSAGLHYVYPVVSRRASGVSVGINLNTNNACNWRCIYCQVPQLKRGKAPSVDLDILRSELKAFLLDMIDGAFLAERVPEGMRRLSDLAFSGNGEPTSAAAFEGAVEVVAQVLSEFGLLGHLPVRLITNGSLVERTSVQRGLRRLGETGGEAWFKVDRATRAGMAAINSVDLAPQTVKRRLLVCSHLLPTWVQTCLLSVDGVDMPFPEQEAYLSLIAEVKPHIRGVLLYGPARQSHQPEAARIARPTLESVEFLARKIRALGVDVAVHA